MKMSNENKELRSKANTKYWDGKRKPRVQKNGYVTLSIGNKRQYVHRMVMEAYLGRPLANDECVHHINGDRTDNRIENLMLIKKDEHSRFHAKERNFGCETGRTPPNKTNKETINQIKELRRQGHLLNEICKMTGISYPTVQKYASQI